MVADPRNLPRDVTRTRVRYPETDRMGVAHHSHYLIWFELGRTELMRKLGCPYGDLEDREGVFFPVVRVGARYRVPARYDEEIEVRTTLRSVKGATVRFEYEVMRAGDGTILTDGFTEHASVGREGRPRRIPRELRERLAGNGGALR